MSNQIGFSGKSVNIFINLVSMDIKLIHFMLARFKRVILYEITRGLNLYGSNLDDF